MSDPASESSQRLKGSSFAETRSAVLDLIRSEGEISRTDLARRSGLTSPTISAIVKSLLESRIVIESGFAHSTGGKRPVLLRLNDKDLYAIGVSLHIARYVVVVCGPDGAEVARTEIRGNRLDDPMAVLKRISVALERLIRRRGIAKESIIGICVAMGGRRVVQDGWPVDASLDRWEQYPVEDELSKITGLTVIRENDANCAALGEFWTSDTSSRDCLTLYLADGIGCGILIGGAIYRGSSGNAGEVGHVQVDPNGLECWCGRRGCLDTVATPRAIAQRILRDQRLAALCQVTQETDVGAIYQRFGQLVREDVPEVVALFEAVADRLAAVVLDLVNSLDLDLVSLAGPGFAHLGDDFQQAIQRRVTELSYLRTVHPVVVRLTAGGIDTAALGAASVVLHRNLTPHHSTPSR